MHELAFTALSSDDSYTSCHQFQMIADMQRQANWLLARTAWMRNGEVRLN